MASLTRRNVLDIMAVLLCAMILLLLVIAAAGRGHGHEGGGIAVLAASLAAVQATRQRLVRGEPPLDAARAMIRKSGHRFSGMDHATIKSLARRRKLIALAILVAVAGAASALVFHLR